jgi:dihydrofolate synthase/folylpolyglutamate synthase
MADNGQAGEIFCPLPHKRRVAGIEDAMTYEEALERLRSLGPELRTGQNNAVARKFTLDHIRVLLDRLGSPQTRFRSVLIAGTNGKGSTAATLASIACAAGIRTGLYTSPHLVRVNERIRTSGESAALTAIPDADFGRWFGTVWQAAEDLVSERILPHPPSFFEFLTATAFAYFAEQGIVLAVLEVGLGGRLDATNVVEPVVSVITDIGIDHTEFLGNTIGEIAAEKAGILRENGVLVTLSQHPEANAAIGAAAVAKDVRGVDASRCLPARDIMTAGGVSDTPDGGMQLARNRYVLSIEGAELRIDSPLAGAHQQRNLALAVATAMELRANHGFTIPNRAIERGVSETVWPGRLEWFPARNGRAAVLLDVAHNPAGAWTLRAAIAQLPEERPRTLLFSCVNDKPVRELAQVLFPLFDSTSSDPLRARDHLVLAPIQNPRATTLDELLAAAAAMDVPAHGAPHLPAALAQAEAVTPADGIIVATGSLYLVGELRALLLEE